MHERIDFVELLTWRFTIFFFVGTAENGPFKVAPSTVQVLPTPVAKKKDGIKASP